MSESSLCSSASAPQRHPAPGGEERESRLLSPFSEPRPEAPGPLTIDLAREMVCDSSFWEQGRKGTVASGARGLRPAGQGGGGPPETGWARGRHRGARAVPSPLQGRGKGVRITPPRERDRPGRHQGLSRGPKRGVFVFQPSLPVLSQG